MKEIYSSLKNVLKQIPLVNMACAYRSEILLRRKRIDTLLRLYKESKIVVFHPYLKTTENEVLSREISYDVFEQFNHEYGIGRLGKITRLSGLPAETLFMLRPLAILKIPSQHEEYLTLVGDKTRNMIRKAEKKGYEFEPFEWNDHLSELYNINTSKKMRQGLPMKESHTKVLRVLGTKYQQYKAYGAFKGGNLWAYLRLVHCGNFAYFVNFIGHADHLTNGIMNGLLSWTVREYIGHPQIRYFNYGGLEEYCKHSMYSFRKHLGFRSYIVLLDLKDNQKLEVIRVSWENN